MQIKINKVEIEIKMEIIDNNIGNKDNETRTREQKRFVEGYTVFEKRRLCGVKIRKYYE